MPINLAVFKSAAPKRSPKSEGLIGEASTRDHDLVGSWFRDCGFRQRQFEFAGLLDQRAKLQSDFFFKTHLKAPVSTRLPLNIRCTVIKRQTFTPPERMIVNTLACRSGSGRHVDLYQELCKATAGKSARWSSAR